MKTGRKKPKNGGRRSLATLILSAMAVVLAVCVLILVVVFSRGMSQMSEQAENDHLSELGKALQGVVEESLNGLYEMTRSYSSYDETYDFALGENQEYMGRFFTDGSTLAVSGLDYVVILDAEGNALFTGSKFLGADVPLAPVPEGLTERVAALSPAVMAGAPQTSGQFMAEGPTGSTGFVVVDGQSYELCVMPILRDRDGGSPVGTFAFAASFGDAEFHRITGLDKATFTIHEQDPAAPVLETEFMVDGDMAISRTPILSRGGGQDAVLEFVAQRHVFDNINAVTRLTGWLFIAAIVAALGILFVFLHWKLVRPMKSLTSDLGTLAEDSELDTKKYSGSEEFFTLSDTLNRTFARLEDSHREEERSKASLDTMKSIMNGLDAYLYVSDPDTDEILFINDNMREHFNIPGDAVGKICWKVLQDGFTERCAFCPNRRFEKDPDAVVVWEEHNTVTGCWYRNTDRLIQWPGGEMGHLQHSVNITDIKMAENQLRRRLDQQALMTAITKSFIFEDDFDKCLNTVLKMAGEFMGVSRVMYFRLDKLGKKLEVANEWLAPDTDVVSRKGQVTDVAGELEDVVGNFASGALAYYSSKDEFTPWKFRLGYLETPSYLSVPVLAKGEMYGILDFGDIDGDSKWSESDISLAQLMASTLSGYFVRSSAEEQLRLLSSVVEYSPVLITTVERDGTPVYVNDAVEAISGYTVQEFMTGGLPLIFGNAELEQIYKKYIPDVMRTGECRFEIDLTRKDGEKRNITYYTFLTGGGKDIIAAIASDITELRRLERQLINARDLAEQGSRSKTEFLSRMSHEMRTPMNAIIGMTNIARATSDPAKKEHSLQRIDSASHHLLGVINDILDMSKIEANKFELSPAAFSFGAMLHNVLNVVNFRLEEKHQKLELDIDRGLPDQLVCDEQRLAQVLTNLLSNAAKFTPEGGDIGLSVKVVSQKWADLVLEFTVSDNGIGISPEQIGKLFRPFEQADGSISRRFGGTGLGLVISKQIVNLMGGNIRVESDLGSGARFIFTVNVRKAEDIGLAVPEVTDAAADGDTEGIFEGRHVLLAEDVEVNCEIVKAILEDTGATIDVAENGIEAVRLFKEGPTMYDLILMDVQMPEMDGLEATRVIRASGLPQGEDVPIIALTANVFREDVELYLSSGMNCHVQKPVDFKELVKTMRRFIGKR